MTTRILIALVRSRTRLDLWHEITRTDVAPFARGADWRCSCEAGSRGRKCWHLRGLIECARLRVSPASGMRVTDLGARYLYPSHGSKGYPMAPVWPLSRWRTLGRPDPKGRGECPAPKRTWVRITDHRRAA